MGDVLTFAFLCRVIAVLLFLSLYQCMIAVLVSPPCNVKVIVFSSFHCTVRVMARLLLSYLA